VIACGQPTAAPETEPKQVEAPFAHAASNPTTGLAALTGTWTGSGEIKGYGFATAVFTLDDKGNGIFVVNLSGASETGTFQLHYWDGKQLEGSALGYRRQVAGELKANALRLELPYVGTVILYRGKAAPAN